MRDKKKIPFGPNTTSTRQAPQDKQLERERERERERSDAKRASAELVEGSAFQNPKDLLLKWQL